MLSLLPDITQVNFCNPDDTEGFAALILAAYNTSSISQISSIRRLAKTWITETGSNLPAYTPGDALTIISEYDLIYRIAYRTPTIEAYINKYIIKAFQASIHNDNTVNYYQLYRTISQQISQHNQTFLAPSFLQWHSQCTDRWHKQFRYGRTLTPLTPYDILNRVSILLDADLWPYETSNQLRFKQMLFDCHSHYLTTLPSLPTSPSTADASSDINPLSLPLLSALNQFLTSSLPYLTPEAYYAYRLSLHHTLLAHPHLNTYRRIALLLNPPVAPSARTAS